MQRTRVRVRRMRGVWIHNACAARTCRSAREVEKSSYCRKVSHYRGDRGKNFQRCEQTFAGAARGLFQVRRKAARPFRSVYSRFTTLLRALCTVGERGCNPIRTRPHDARRPSHKRIFYGLALPSWNLFSLALSRPT